MMASFHLGNLLSLVSGLPVATPMLFSIMTEMNTISISLDSVQWISKDVSL